MVVKSWLSLICIFLDEWMRLLDYVASSPKGSDDVQSEVSRFNQKV